MAFWSGERLAQELPTLIDPFTPTQLDCATYRLSVGEQAFVTTDRLSLGAPDDKFISVLGAPPRHMLSIPPGQFAFLLTHEKVTVPNSAIALISMRAKYKFRGLINVSGFHVDPGWSGKLIFSVYNAGPAPILIEKEEQLFLIVYADLDRRTTKVYHGDAQGQNAIKPALIANLASQVFSPQVLKAQLDKVYKKMARIELMTNVAAGVGAALGVITTIVIATVALLPSWTGVVIARTLDAAGYEIKQRPLTPAPTGQAPSSSNAPSPANPTPPGPAPKSDASNPIAPKH